MWPIGINTLKPGIVKGLLILLIVAINTAFGQLELKGRVIDSNNVPLPGVNILIRGTVIGTSSNSEGEFELKIHSDSCIVEFSSLGFNTEQLKVVESKTVEIKLHEEFPSDSFWGLKRGKKPLSKKKTKYGTVTLYAREQIQLEPISPKTKLVVWQQSNYKILLPLDSLNNYLASAGYRHVDMDFGLKYLKSNVVKDTVFLSNEFIERVGEVSLNQLAIKMLKTKTIMITNKQNAIIKTITVKDVFRVGPCSPCCWGGIEFIVSEMDPPLFTITRIIC